MHHKKSDLPAEDGKMNTALEFHVATVPEWPVMLPPSLPIYPTPAVPDTRGEAG